MSLYTPRGSRAALEQLTSGLIQAAQTSESLQNRLAEVPQDALSALTPLRIYSLRCEDLLETGLSSAKAVGWLYVLLAGGPAIPLSERTPVALVDLVDAGEGFQLRGAAVDNDGTDSSVRDFFVAVNKAQEWAEAADSAYDLRVLKITTIHVSSLWLQGANPENDFFILLSPMYRGGSDFEELDAATFVARMSALTKKARARRTKAKRRL